MSLVFTIGTPQQTWPAVRSTEVHVTINSQDECVDDCEEVLEGVFFSLGCNRPHRVCFNSSSHFMANVHSDPTD